jgi:hypothetical protein
MKASRTWQAVLGGSRNIRFSDAVRLAEAFGFTTRRVRGSHHIMLHSRLPVGLNLQPDRSGNAKPYQLRQLVDLVETYGLTLEEP